MNNNNMNTGGYNGTGGSGSGHQGPPYGPPKGPPYEPPFGIDYVPRSNKYQGDFGGLMDVLFRQYDDNLKDQKNTVYNDRYWNTKGEGYTLLRSNKDMMANLLKDHPNYDTCHKEALGGQVVFYTGSSRRVISTIQLMSDIVTMADNKGITFESKYK